MISTLEKLVIAQISHTPPNTIATLFKAAANQEIPLTVQKVPVNFGEFEVVVAFNDYALIKYRQDPIDGTPNLCYAHIYGSPIMYTVSESSVAAGKQE